jgi:hypothetical protein
LALAGQTRYNSFHEHTLLKSVPENSAWFT